MLNKLNLIFQKNAYLIYLFTLVFWIGFLPLFEIFGLIKFFEFIIVNIVFLSAFYFFKQDKKKIKSFIIVPLTALTTYLNFFIIENEILGQIDRLLLLILFFLITVHLLKKIFKHKDVDKEVIIISITAYIMIGFMSAILCWFTYILYPGAYNMSIDNYGPLIDFTYYSMVTMSTLGYGDVLPLLPQSKSLAIVITLVGQFYMAILVAFLIGKSLNQRK